ncbi:MAG: SMC-Scp complex subunit ScpB [Acidobacteria bacterium]|nr:SMC-Scp complex subunit ScpB [Acidobacteriota bacterium]
MENLETNTSSAIPATVLKAAVEAIVYVADDPVTVDQITSVLEGATRQEVLQALITLQNEYAQGNRGIEILEVAGGYKMFTKAEHHEAVRKFVKDLTPPLRLSMAALETLATIAYRQPITLPEIQQIRGVNATAAVKTLLDRKLITTAGRKNVIGRPILYKTTKHFLVQFGLSGLQELPSMEEFEELARAAVGDLTPQPEFPSLAPKETEPPEIVESADKERDGA